MPTYTRHHEVIDFGLSPRKRPGDGLRETVVPEVVGLRQYPDIVKVLYPTVGDRRNPSAITVS